MDYPVIEIDNMADLVRWSSYSRLNTGMTQADKDILKQWYLDQGLTSGYTGPLYLRLTKDLDLNQTEYWNKPEGSIFINSPLYIWGNTDMLNIGGTSQGINLFKVIDGGIYDSNGNLTGKHAITNIFLRKDSIFYNSNLEANSTQNIKVIEGMYRMKNLTIEAITSSGFILGLWLTGGKDNTNAAALLECYLFSNVTFNIKSYGMQNGLFGIRGTSSSNYNEVSNPPKGLRQFENCVFNIYLASISDINTYENTLFRTTPDANTGYTPRINFLSCIFRIRNATDKVYSIVSQRNYNDTTPTCKFDNCAFFIQDVGVNKPSYPADDDQYVSHKTKFIKIIILRGGYGSIYEFHPLKLTNCYFAAFGDVNSNEKAQIYLVGYENDYENVQTYAQDCSSSFYDKDKVLIFGRDPSTGIGDIMQYDEAWLHALTTAECKDKNKLSEIGYIFCEET